MLIENKVTEKKSYKINEEDLKKHVNESTKEDRMPVFSLEFKSHDKQYIIIPEWLFTEFIDYVKDKCKGEPA